MKAFMVTACATALMLFSTPAYVHHSGALFDQSKEVKVSGTVRELHWTNPHASFLMEVDKDSKLETWAVEMGSPNNLVREGWKRSTIKPGDKVTVMVNPLRDGQPGGLYIGIVLPDGKSLGRTEAK